MLRPCDAPRTVWPSTHTRTAEKHGQRVALVCRVAPGAGCSAPTKTILGGNSRRRGAYEQSYFRFGRWSEMLQPQARNNRLCGRDCDASDSRQEVLWKRNSARSAGRCLRRRQSAHIVDLNFCRLERTMTKWKTEYSTKETNPRRSQRKERWMTR